MLSLGIDPGKTRQNPSGWGLINTMAVKPEIVDCGTIHCHNRPISEFILELDEVAHRIASYGHVSVAGMENQYLGKKQSNSANCDQKYGAKADREVYFVKSSFEIVRFRALWESAVARIIRPDLVLLPYPAEWWSICLQGKHSRTRAQAKEIASQSFLASFGNGTKLGSNVYAVKKNQDMVDALNISLYAAYEFISWKRLQKVNTLQFY